MLFPRIGFAFRTRGSWPCLSGRRPKRRWLRCRHSARLAGKTGLLLPVVLWRCGIGPWSVLYWTTVVWVSRLPKPGICLDWRSYSLLSWSIRHFHSVRWKDRKRHEPGWSRKMLVPANVRQHVHRDGSITFASVRRLLRLPGAAGRPAFHVRSGAVSQRAIGRDYFRLGWSALSSQEWKSVRCSKPLPFGKWPPR